jgi:hypothetical protein
MLAVPIALAVYAFIDVISMPSMRFFRGPKWLWAIAVLVLPVLGPVLWFVVGRPRRAANTLRYSTPDDDPDFLRGINYPRRPSGDDDSPKPSAS